MGLVFEIVRMKSYSVINNEMLQRKIQRLSIEQWNCHAGFTLLANN